MQGTDTTGITHSSEKYFCSPEGDSETSKKC